MFTTVAEQSEGPETTTMAHRTQDTLLATFPRRGGTHKSQVCAMLHRGKFYREGRLDLGGLQERPLHGESIQYTALMKYLVWLVIELQL